MPSLIRTNISNTGTPVNGNTTGIEVQNQNLSGSEPNFDCMFEEGNLKLSLLQVDNAVKIWNQNLYYSESSIDRSYGRVNPQFLTFTGLQDRIIEVHNNPHYGSDSNINYDEGRISESSESSRLNLSVRVGDQNLLCGPGPNAVNKSNLKIQDTRVGSLSLSGSGPSIGNEYRINARDTRVGDQNLIGSRPKINSLNRMIRTDNRVGGQNLSGSGPSIDLYRINAVDTRVGDQNLIGPGPDNRNLITLDHLNPIAMDLELRGTESIITNENSGVGLRSVINPLNPSFIYSSEVNQLIKS